MREASGISSQHGAEKDYWRPKNHRKYSKYFEDTYSLDQILEFKDRGYSSWEVFMAQRFVALNKRYLVFGSVERNQKTLENSIDESW